MAQDAMELIGRANEQYALAGNEKQKAEHAASRARDAYVVAAERRVEQYNKVLAGGFIIERIVDPRRISYLAGYKEGNIFDPEGRDEPVHLELDKDHAQGLVGAFATDFETHLSFVEDENYPGHNFRARFVVAGDHDNSDTSWIDEPLRDYEEDFRQYRGALDAIEWRLPTQDEIVRFGGGVAAQAQIEA